MKYLKNEDSSMIVKWNEEAETAIVLNLLIDGEASNGIQVERVLFTEDDAKDFTEIEESEYTTIRNGKMTDYWNETAA